jgi:predicted N-acyltransferase
VALAIGAVPPPPYFFVKRFPPLLLSLFERVASKTFAFCGAPFNARLDGLAFRPDVTDTSAITTAILAAFDKFTRQHKCLVQVFVSAEGTDSPPHSEFVRRGYSAIPAVSYAVMEVGQWDSFDAYLATLSSKRRIETRRQLRKANENGVTISRLHPHAAAALDEDMYRLYRQTFVYHGLSRPWLDKGFFPALRTHLPENATLLIAQVQDQLVGFILGLHDRHTIDYPILGLDYTLSREYGVYFLLHYEMIRYAIDGGFRTSYAGTTTLDLKRRLGYQVGHRYYFLRSPSRPLDRSLQTLIRSSQAATARWLGKDL